MWKPPEEPAGSQCIRRYGRSRNRAQRAAPWGKGNGAARKHHLEWVWFDEAGRGSELYARASTTSLASGNRTSDRRRRNWAEPRLQLSPARSQLRAPTFTPGRKPIPLPLIRRWPSVQNDGRTMVYRQSNGRQMAVRSRKSAVSSAAYATFGMKSAGGGLNASRWFCMGRTWVTPVKPLKLEITFRRQIPSRAPQRPLGHERLKFWDSL